MAVQPIVYRFNPGTLSLHQGDITSSDAAAVVNAANSGLRGGAGVDGAIHAAAGPNLPIACKEVIKKHGPVEPGQAAVTPGFAMKAGIIIHAVGPIWRGGENGEHEQLASTYAVSMRLAGENSCRSVAFPAISTGAYGFPLELAAPIALKELQHGVMQKIVDHAELWLFSEQQFEAWRSYAAQNFGEPD